MNLSFTRCQYSNLTGIGRTWMDPGLEQPDLGKRGVHTHTVGHVSGNAGENLEAVSFLWKIKQGLLRRGGNDTKFSIGGAGDIQRRRCFRQREEEVQSFLQVVVVEKLSVFVKWQVAGCAHNLGYIIIIMYICVYWTLKSLEWWTAIYLVGDGELWKGLKQKWHDCIAS